MTASEAAWRLPTRPNVLFISCDQWRGDCLSAAGHPVVRTPNIDALAAEGVLFARHYAGAAPCAPARACLYTGLYQMTNRVCRNGTPLDDRHDNIARAARRLGYDPTLFGYTDVAPDPRRHDPADPVLRGYEGILPGFTVRQLLPEHQKPWLSWLAARGHDVSMGSPAIHRPADPSAPAISLAPPAYAADETETAFMAGEFIRWLTEQDAGKPWFAHLSFIRPHPPFIVPEPYASMFDPSDGPGFARAASAEADEAIHPLVRFLNRKTKTGKFLPGVKGRVRDLDDLSFRAIRAIYWGMIAEVDAQLGRIWQALKAAGAWDDTLIVFTSDHAEMMGDHHTLGKGGFFEGSYHIPLVIRDPRKGSVRGGRVKSFTEAVDIFPTLVDLIGGVVPQHLDGHSLAPAVTGTGLTAPRDCAHWEFDFRSIAKADAEKAFGLPPQACNLAVIRTDAAKYVHFAGMPPALFDLRDDPDETVNRAEDPAFAHLRLEMAERLLAWRSRYLDQRLALVELTAEGVRSFVGN